jgi:hypothetical protein
LTEKALVTVRAETLGFSADMELPTRRRIGTLAANLLEGLKTAGVSGFAGIDAISLYCDGRPLPETSTLEAESVWDGKILEIKRR